MTKLVQYDVEGEECNGRLVSNDGISLFNCVQVQRGDRLSRTFLSNVLSSTLLYGRSDGLDRFWRQRARDQ